MKYLDYHESKQHGSRAFPIQYYDVQPTHPQYKMPLHWHREMELIRVRSGRLRLFLDNTEYLLCPGETAVVNSGTLHRGDPEDDSPYECAVFDLNMLRRHQDDVLNGFFLPLLSQAMRVQPLFSAESPCAAAAGKLFTLLKRGTGELEIYSCLYHFFASVFDSRAVLPEDRSRPAGHQMQVLMDLLDWIEANYTERITLRQLASLSGMNEKYLCRFFRQYTSMTPIAYVNQLRLEAACHLLLHEHKTVTEAAMECGFGDMSYFSKLFRRYKGMSPRDFAKEE